MNYRDQLKINNKEYQKTLAQIMSVVRAMGYSQPIQHFVEKEVRKDFSDTLTASTCKRCSRKLYQVVIHSNVDQLPRKKRICSQCANISDNFKPRIDFETAWRKCV